MLSLSSTGFFIHAMQNLTLRMLKKKKNKSYMPNFQYQIFFFSDTNYFSVIIINRITIINNSYI
jgi:hypothetical protein